MAIRLGTLSVLWCPVNSEATVIDTFIKWLEVFHRNGGTINRVGNAPEARRLIPLKGEPSIPPRRVPDSFLARIRYQQTFDDRLVLAAGFRGPLLGWPRKPAGGLLLNWRASCNPGLDYIACAVQGKGAATALLWSAARAAADRQVDQIHAAVAEETQAWFAARGWELEPDPPARGTAGMIWPDATFRKVATLT